MAQLTLVMTSYSCPEQYDVYRGIRKEGDERVGYLRLRHGYFRAECPRGNVVFETWIDDRGVLGHFGDNERYFYLREACGAILMQLGEIPERDGSRVFDFETVNGLFMSSLSPTEHG